MCSTPNTANNVVVHDAPVWRERANFIIAARIDRGNAAPDWRWEQLWARQIAETQFEICCIPFFIYDLALGDTVQTEPLEARTYVVSRVVIPGGHVTFRAWFEDPLARTAVMDDVVQLGCLVEWRYSTGRLMAVDAPDEAVARSVADFLRERQLAQQLVYETGRGH